MRLIKFLLLLFICLSLQAGAQETKPALSALPAQFPHLTLRVEYFRFISREPNLGIEWRKSFRHSHEIRIGYLYSQPINRFAHERIFARSTMAKYQGPSIGYQYRFWLFMKNTERYLKAGVVFRYLSYTDEVMMYLDNSDVVNVFNKYVLSQWRSDAVLSLAYCNNANPFQKPNWEFTVGVVAGTQYTRVTECEYCDPLADEAEFETQTRNAANDFFPTDGFILRPWVRLTLSVPYYLIKAERRSFRE